MGAIYRTYKLTYYGKVYTGTYYELQDQTGIPKYQLQKYRRAPTNNVRIEWLNKKTISEKGGVIRNDILCNAIKEAVENDDLHKLYAYCERYEINYPKASQMRKGACIIALRLKTLDKSVKERAKERLAKDKW